MSAALTISSKYRGTTVYLLVYGELTVAARYRGLTTYQRIAEIMGLAEQGNLMGSEIGQILGEISEDELRAGRPLLSAVAVGVSGTPGAGFYACASALGRMTDHGGSEERFWDTEREAVYRAWSWVPFSRRREAYGR